MKLKLAEWRRQIRACPDPARAKVFLAKLAESSGRLLASFRPEQRQVLLALLGGSQVLSEWLAAYPDTLQSPFFDPEFLSHARQKQGLQCELDEALRPLVDAHDYDGMLRRLREFKQREMFRIALRDLARLGSVGQIIQEISNVADVCLEVVLDLCERKLVERLGRPHHRDASGAWKSTTLCIIGLGKLGGQELNYSSDVDVVFVYDDEGFVFRQRPRRGAPGQGMSSHQFFTRLAESIINEVARLTPEGRLFRIDLRLRPEGNAGPLVRSLGSYENYYAQWGQIWERMMLIKARGVAGNASLAGEFLETIQAFRYPRSLGERALREVAAMKQRIEQEVVRQGEMERNVKLGRGGIREIEFSVQVLQVLHGGRSPFLQERRTLAALQKLVEYNLMPGEDSRVLSQAYDFLREVEHRLQMEANLQTHTVPEDPESRQRLAVLMGFAQSRDFESALQNHMTQVRQVFDKLVNNESASATAGIPPELAGHESEWKAILADHRFRDPEKAFRILNALVNGPGYVHVSQHTVDLAMLLIPRLLSLCPRMITPPGSGSASPSAIQPGSAKVLSDPDRVLARLDSYVNAYGARATMFETWASNPSLFELLLLLFDRSEFLAEVAIRTPDLVDELALSGRLRRAKSTEETLKDLRYGAEDADQRLWIRRYHQAEQMRIGLRDILGLCDFEQNLGELTALASACLQYALEVVLRRHHLKKPPVAIVGMGKLGGGELTYGSDLDVVFIAPTNTKNLSKLQRLAAETMELLTSQTELGTAFQVDARLRPDGAKGLLVNTLKGFEDYYRQRAMLWEIQTLTRARFVAGDAAVGGQFEELATALSNFKTPSLPLAAFKPDWQAEIARMRARIEKERTPTGQQTLAFKTGAGGLIDAEFVAQTLCLAHGWREPNTLRALKRARQEMALPAVDADALIENYGRLQRLEGVLRRWSFVGESVLPDDPAPQYRVAVRCGFPDGAQFLSAVSEWRAAIRRVYERFFSMP